MAKLKCFEQYLILNSNVICNQGGIMLNFGTMKKLIYLYNIFANIFNGEAILPSALAHRRRYLWISLSLSFPA